MTNTKTLTTMAVLLTTIIICSKLAFPLFEISLTLQTLAIAFSALILKKKSLIVILTYIIMGLIGLPVFATGGGLHYVLQPSFGFIIGFIPFALCVSSNNKIVRYILSLFILYSIGIIYMYFNFKYYLNSEKSIIYLIQIAILPFILKDIFSIFLASIIKTRIRNI